MSVSNVTRFAFVLKQCRPLLNWTVRINGVAHVSGDKNGDAIAI